MRSYTIGYTAMNDKPEKFILNSDYATLANNSETISCVVTIPATSIASGVTQTFDNTVSVGSAGSPMECDINYSLTSDRWSGQQMLFVENTGTPSQYQGNVVVYRNSPTTVRVRVAVSYFGPGSITKTARTVTVRIRSFVPPFS